MATLLIEAKYNYTFITAVLHQHDRTLDMVSVLASIVLNYQGSLALIVEYRA